MSLFALGVNHQSAPVDLRESLEMARPRILEAVDAWRQAGRIHESVVLSTCNRFELYLFEAGKRSGETLLKGLFETLELSPEEERCFYLYSDKGAARHLFRVTASLDSMVLGEDQIQGQVKQSYHQACEAKTTGPVLNHLFHQALRVGKQIRTETPIARAPVSMASAAIQLVREVYGDLHSLRVLVVGVGEMARLALKHLKDRGAKQLTVANRTFARAKALAETEGVQALALAEVPGELKNYDAVFSAVAIQDPWLTKEQVAACLESRAPDPLLLVDLGVPRNLSPQIDELETAYLYNVDDLEAATADSRRARAEAAEHGEILAESSAREFERWLQGRAVIPVIRELIDKSQDLAEQEFLRRAPELEDPALKEACLDAVRAAVKKMLHHPLRSLRSLSEAEERRKTLAMVQELFQLEGLEVKSEATEASPAEAPTQDNLRKVG